MNENQIIKAKIHEDNLLTDFMGNPYKTSVANRLKNSKFAKLISNLSDDEIKLLVMVVGFNHDSLKAVKMYLVAVDTTIQKHALKLELKKRGIAK